jgi:hypothetical protein
MSNRASRSGLSEPTWTEAVKNAKIGNEPRVIAAWCELPLQVVVAVFVILEARGELPAHPSWW